MAPPSSANIFRSEGTHVFGLERGRPAFVRADRVRPDAKEEIEAAAGTSTASIVSTSPRAHAVRPYVGLSAGVRTSSVCGNFRSSDNSGTTSG